MKLRLLAENHTGGCVEGKRAGGRQRYKWEK